MARTAALRTSSSKKSSSVHEGEPRLSTHIGGLHTIVSTRRCDGDLWAVRARADGAPRTIDLLVVRDSPLTPMRAGTRLMLKRMQCGESVVYVTC